MKQLVFILVTFAIMLALCRASAGDIEDNDAMGRLVALKKVNCFFYNISSLLCLLFLY
jgi:hypothetical protein